MLKAIGLAAAVLACGTAISSPSQAQQDWPNRAVKVVVPFGAGGAADRLGRIAADHLSKAFKQQIREFLDYAKKFDGVWWATREEIADWYLKNHQSHIG